MIDRHVKAPSKVDDDLECMFFSCRCSQGLIKDLCYETTACEIILQTALDLSFNSNESELPIKAVLLSSPKLEHTQGTAGQLQGPLQASSQKLPTSRDKRARPLTLPWLGKPALRVSKPRPSDVVGIGWGSR